MPDCHIITRTEQARLAATLRNVLRQFRQGYEAHYRTRPDIAAARLAQVDTLTRGLNTLDAQLTRARKQLQEDNP